MTWWYENEEKEMKSCEYCSHEDCKNIGGTWYCLDCPECGVNWKDRKMEFDKSRVYTALNADELRAGDKVIVADTMAELKMYVEQNTGTIEIEKIEDDNYTSRFTTPNTNSWRVHFPLAYLVERKENCLNCSTSCMGKSWLADQYTRCDSYKPIAKTENCTNCGNRITCARQMPEHPELESCNDWKPKTKKEIDMNWNYEGLPEKQEMGVSDRVVVAVEGCPYVQTGYYDYELEAWFVDNNRYPVPVYAWQAIKPPREA